MRRILTTRFFNRPTLEVARDLLGNFLVRRVGRKIISGMITEAEAYVGPEDKASHASRGMTNRTRPMFGRPGHWYVYLIYGMHHCLNVVTEKEQYPAAVLIRSVEGVKGPGRVCRHFKIDKRFNAQLANKKTGLWVEDRGVRISPHRIKRGKRIGVEYAGEWKDQLWRLYL